MKLKNKKKVNLEKIALGNLSRIFLVSLTIMSFFFITPIVLQFAKNTSLVSKEFENNSKNNLKRLLEKKDIESEKISNQKFLFEDVLMLDEKPTDSVRLSAITIEELFKSTNYILEDVRKTKLVKPISLTLLPNEIKKIDLVKFKI